MAFARVQTERDSAAHELKLRSNPTGLCFAVRAACSGDADDGTHQQAESQPWKSPEKEQLVSSALN